MYPIMSKDEYDKQMLEAERDYLVAQYEYWDWVNQAGVWPK